MRNVASRVLLVVSWLPAGVGAARAVTAAPAADPVAGLAAGEPAARAAAARALGASYEAGGALAHVLATLALEDDDASVRTAATDAVETLAATACERWRSWLDETQRKPQDRPAYRDVAELLAGMGSKITLPDIAAGLEASGDDPSRAEILATLPLALRTGERGFDADPTGLDVLLTELVRTGGERTAAQARDGLVLYAGARLRLGTRGAPGPAPGTTLEAGSWLALLDAKDRWIHESALVVLASVGRPGHDVLARLAETRCLPALALLGRGAESVVAKLDAAAGSWPPSMLAYARWRLGQREGLLPAPSGDDPQAQLGYARACAALASWDPERVRPEVPTLTRLVVASGAPAPRAVALLALARIPALPVETRQSLVEFTRRAESREYHAALVNLALGRAGEADASILSALVRHLAVQESESAGVGTEFREELGRTLGSLASRLDPVRGELEAQLSNPRVQPTEHVAILRVLGGLRSADAGTVAVLRKALETRAGDWAPSPSGAPPLPFTQRVRLLGSVAGWDVEARRAAAASLGALGARAVAARGDLDALTRDVDPLLRWYARRALAKIGT